MTKAKKYRPTFTNRQAMKFAMFCQLQCDSLPAAAAEARRITQTIRGSSRKRGTWKYFFLRFAAAIDAGRLPHEIFAMSGNVKLPFVAFSTLPIVTCPGAGDCKSYCYSLRAWRYPAAFLRQCMNTLLLRFNRRAIIDAFKGLPAGLTFRLYVDGDFDSSATLMFWMNLLNQRQDIACYGYSKSWELFLSYPMPFPPNYVLNISSGSRYDADAGMRQRMLELPITRGEFIAVLLNRKHAKGFAKYDSPDYHRDVRESAAAQGHGKVFSCPGTCGGCTMKGHACGAVFVPAHAGVSMPAAETGRKFLMPLPIAIGIH
jgi:hypothetical protein